MTAPPQGFLGRLKAAEAVGSARTPPTAATGRRLVDARPPDTAGLAAVVEVSPEVVLPAAAGQVKGRPTTPSALLLVQPAGDDECRVVGYTGGEEGQEPDLDNVIYRPDIALGDLATSEPGGEQAADVRYVFRNWSRDNATITAWFEQLRETTGDDLHLVVWDCTGHDIPWELFHLPGDRAIGRPPGWLGALVPVARRLSIREYGLTWDPWSFSVHASAGRVVATIAESMAADREFLARFDPLHVVENDLVEHLADSRDDVGLLYIACHGAFEKERLLRLRLGSLSVRDIDERGDLPGLHRAHAVVFLNACHSGRVTRDLRQRVLSGFAEVFLRKGAVAVVGVLGSVETDLANRVAASIVAEVADRPDRSLAVVLRDVRAVAARDADEAGPDSTDALKRFLYTFMYILWGSPYARVAMPSAGGGDG